MRALSSNANDLLRFLAVCALNLDFLLRCRVPLQGAAIRVLFVLCVLWSLIAGAAAGCRHTRVVKIEVDCLQANSCVTTPVEDLLCKNSCVTTAVQKLLGKYIVGVGTDSNRSRSPTSQLLSK